MHAGLKEYLRLDDLAHNLSPKQKKCMNPISIYANESSIEKPWLQHCCGGYTITDLAEVPCKPHTVANMSTCDAKLFVGSARTVWFWNHDLGKILTSSSLEYLSWFIAVLTAVGGCSWVFESSLWCALAPIFWRISVRNPATCAASSSNYPVAGVCMIGTTTVPAVDSLSSPLSGIIVKTERQKLLRYTRERRL